MHQKFLDKRKKCLGTNFLNRDNLASSHEVSDAAAVVAVVVGVAVCARVAVTFVVAIYVISGVVVASDVDVVVAASLLVVDVVVVAFDAVVITGVLDTAHVVGLVAVTLALAAVFAVALK